MYPKDSQLNKFLFKDTDSRKNLFNGFLFWALIFSPSLIVGLFETYSLISAENLGIFNFFKYFPGIANTSNNELFTIIFRVTLILLPISAITIFELITKKYFSETSLGRLNRAGGMKLPDLWYYLIIGIFGGHFPFLLTFLTIGLSDLNKGFSNSLSSLLQNIPFIPPTELTSSLIIVIAILLTELARYIKHRMAHEVDFIWDLHEFHHSLKEMTILGKNRGTPLQGAFTEPFVIPLSIINGLLIKEYLSQGFIAPLVIYIFYSTIALVAQNLGHSSTKIVYPKPLSYLLMSPSLHWLHHSDNPDHFNCNFGQVFTIWDKLFGSYIDETHIDEVTQLGVKNSLYNNYHPLYSCSILPLRKISKRISRFFIA